MTTYVARINLGNEEDYNSKIIEQKYNADSAEAVEQLVLDEHGDARLYWVKQLEELPDRPFFDGKRVVRGKVDELSDEELVQWLANATKTHYACGGHKKAARNERLSDSYREKLKARGVKIPDTRALLDSGVFNGAGAS